MGGRIRRSQGLGGGSGRVGTKGGRGSTWVPTGRGWAAVGGDMERGVWSRECSAHSPLPSG